MNASPTPANGQRLRVIDHDAAERAAIQGENAPAFELETLGSLLGPAIDRAEQRRNGTEVPVPLPFRELAENFGGGLWPGAHSLVSGTGVGKSQIAIACGLHAAQHKASVCYIGLELDQMQLALRVIGARAGLRWSGLYLGRCSVEDLAKARGTVAELEGLPFYVDFGSARSWPASRLDALAETMRRRQPRGPILIVLDYLQLVGDEPNEFQRKPDLRERIGGAAYAARDVARRFGVSVLLISSAARNHYGLLAGDFASAGLTVRPGTGKVIAHPYVLQGLGKESGELEFSLDTNTVMLRWPARLDNGEAVILAASPKVRAGVERWCAFAFDGGRFAPLEVSALDDLPTPPKRVRPGGRVEVTEDDWRARVLASARKNPRARSRNALALMTAGTRTHVLAAIEALVGAGELEFTRDGVVVRLDGRPNA